LAAANPFAKVKHAAGNPLERRRYVTREETRRLMETAANWVWRSIIALCVQRAGLEPWPRLFPSLRASCETDLASRFPIATACKWIGNTVAIAAKLYVVPLDEHFQRAAGLAIPAAMHTSD